MLATVSLLRKKDKKKKQYLIYISVWIYKNDTIELPLPSASSGRFFLARDYLQR